MNEESFDRFKFRSNFTKAIREFYWKNNFTEIETPVLGSSAS
jgi:lysyl-tRNA synthetase class II